MKQKRKVSKFIYWAPRILSIIFVLFLALFSLDVFENNYTFWQTVIGLLMHNIPAIILLIVLVISWKHEIVGVIAFAITGLAIILFLIIAERASRYEIIFPVIFVLCPALLISILFYINWKRKMPK